jgi:3-oxoacyl-[acyl-carrier protein] reductase
MKTVVITGAAVGIGAALARELAPGNSVVLHYHSSLDALESLAKELAPVAAAVDTVAADLATEDGCQRLYAQIEARHPRVEVLVNNAGGMLERRAVSELSWDHLVSTFALNSFSAMRMTALCAGLLTRGTNPCVVNISSIAIRHGAPSATAYGAAKAALDAFTRGAATELAPAVRVNAVAPGIIDTRFHERVTTEAKMRQFIESTPLRRAGTADEVAKAVRFLVDSEFITGETLDCNGGLWMR